MFYSYKSKFPAPLPETIFFPDGSSKPSSEFTDSELKELGYSGPYEIPVIFDAWNFKLIWDGVEFFIVKRDAREMMYIGMGLDYMVDDADATEEILWQRVKDIRDKMLTESDWVEIAQTTDKPLVNIDAWRTFRQQLRDLPKSFENPLDVVLPEIPETTFINGID
jgi:hypothetical protein